MTQTIGTRYSRQSTGTYLDLDVELPSCIDNYEDCYDYLMEYGVKQLGNFHLESFEDPECWLEDCWDDDDCI
jgi:hypothetical protein